MIFFIGGKSDILSGSYLPLYLLTNYCFFGLVSLSLNTSTAYYQTIVTMTSLPGLPLAGSTLLHSLSIHVVSVL